MKLKIIHGTCESMADVPSNSIGGAVTSPPYFNAKDYGDKTTGNIGTSDVDTTRTPYQVYLSMMKNVFVEIYRVLKQGRYLLMNAAPIVYEQQRYPVPYHLFNLMEEVGFDYADNIIWKKPDGITSSKRFGVCMQQPYPLYYKPNNVYEPCFLMRKGVPQYPDYSDVDHKHIEKLSIDKLKKFQNDVWQIQPDTHNEHPAPFPYQLPWRFIYALVPRDESVLDPFGGSGTTALAARDLDVDCILYELESKYVNMIKERVASSQGLGKFVEGAKDIQVEVVEQKNVLRRDFPNTKPISKMARPSALPLKKVKQVEIHKRRLYMCDICDIEWEITNNQFYAYHSHQWVKFEGHCPNCAMKVREIK